MKSVVICAIGGIISKSKDNRIMFCRETFYDADLETLEINCEHLGIYFNMYWCSLGNKLAMSTGAQGFKILWVAFCFFYAKNARFMNKS